MKGCHLIQMDGSFLRNESMCHQDRRLFMNNTVKHLFHVFCHSKFLCKCFPMQKSQIVVQHLEGSITNYFQIHENYSKVTHHLVQLRQETKYLSSTASALCIFFVTALTKRTKYNLIYNNTNLLWIETTVNNITECIRN